MAKKDIVDVFTPDRADSLRKELDSKIEQKVSNHVFYWAIVIFLAVIGGAFAYISKVNDKVYSVNDRLIRIETLQSVKK